MGRKSPGKDPVLQGRADYICEVIPYGCWIAEVKSPSSSLSDADAQQAHTYAAHPEIAARFYLLTNGRKFKLYQTSSPYEPLLSWLLEETEAQFHSIKNILGPDAIQRFGTIKIDTGKPLAAGLGSTAIITGGWMVYDSHESSNLRLAESMATLKGMRNGIRGQEVIRTNDGLIEARVELVPAFSAFDELNRFFGFVPLVFRCADEIISSDDTRPSIFQNILTVNVPRGTSLPTSLLYSGGTVPIDCKITYYTRVVGYLLDSKLVGVFESVLELDLVTSQSLPTQAVSAFGKFELALS